MRDRFSTIYHNLQFSAVFSQIFFHFHSFSQNYFTQINFNKIFFLCFSLFSASPIFIRASVLPLRYLVYIYFCFYTASRVYSLHLYIPNSRIFLTISYKNLLSLHSSHYFLQLLTSSLNFLQLSRFSLYYSHLQFFPVSSQHLLSLTIISNLCQSLPTFANVYQQSPTVNNIHQRLPHFIYILSNSHFFSLSLQFFLSHFFSLFLNFFNSIFTQTSVWVFYFPTPHAFSHFSLSLVSLFLVSLSCTSILSRACLLFLSHFFMFLVFLSLASLSLVSLSFLTLSLAFSLSSLGPFS